VLSVHAVRCIVPHGFTWFGCASVLQPLKSPSTPDGRSDGIAIS
jgi:hypothetical protein